MKTINKTKRVKRKKVFTRKHYESNDGMLTAIWGPSTWHLLHTMSFNYPVNPTVEDKRHYRDFIINLQYVLPCGKCRKNLKENLLKLPLKMSHMKTRETFSLYVYKLHEVINKMLGKKSGLSYSDVKERYEHFRARCIKPLDEMNSAGSDVVIMTTDSNEQLSLHSYNKREPEEIMKTGKEKGCTEPLYGEKSKCILKIVPYNTPCNTFDIDEKCMKRKITDK